MSIHCLVGAPGAGKSYEACQRAYDAVSAGRAVVTNLPLKLTHEFWKQALEDELLFMLESTSKLSEGSTFHFGHLDGWADIMDKKKKLYHRTLKLKSKSGTSSIAGPLVIVDEASLTFDEMITNKRKDASFGQLMNFFKVHRHSLVDVLLMYHEHGQIDPKIKQVNERYHHVMNTTEMMGYNSYRVGISMKGFGSRASFISEQNNRFKSSVFDLYDSFSEGDGSGHKGQKNESGLSRAKPFWMRPWFVIVVVLAVFILPVGVYKSVKRVKSMLSPDVSKPVLNKSSDIVVNGGRTGAPRLAPVIVAPKINNPITESLGWPDTDTPFVGFDNENIYFGGGVRLNLRSDIQPSGFQILDIILCRITMTRVIDLGEVTARQVVEYTCSKGN